MSGIYPLKTKAVSIGARKLVRADCRSAEIKTTLHNRAGDMAQCEHIFQQRSIADKASIAEIMKLDRCGAIITASAVHLCCVDDFLLELLLIVGRGGKRRFPQNPLISVPVRNLDTVRSDPASIIGH